ncbi:MAG TPA: hypothetical protein VHL31_12180 [Geminicoccus sp.]|uniref:hypothetical protein n=1 Tax=Geminicoccus sp. TaxID=2024832 RepID=UPI002E2ECC32|nr:hypothetical protein [Geminicoccus sp.]HEX2527038.1 hypothetical protein [Geminicoccus sp.]
MLRGLFVDRHFYSYDGTGRGRWKVFTRAAQIRLALAVLLLTMLVAVLGGTFAYGWLQSHAMPAPALANVPVVRAPEPPPVAVDEIQALRTALDETRQKRAELAAELEGLKRRPVQAGPTQAAYDELRASFDRLQASHDEAVRRAEAAEQAAARAAEAAELARREAAARGQIDEATIPDRIRALELELEMARTAALPDDATALEQDPRYGEDPVDHAFTPQEEELALRVRELEATVAELEAERTVLEQRLAEAGQPVDLPAQGDAQPSGDEPAGPTDE